MKRHPPTLSIERVHDLQRWRSATEEVQADYYTLELMLALYDHAPVLLDAAEACFELEAEVDQLRAELDALRRCHPERSEGPGGR